ncbi:hypothetical protein EG867_16730, partial [Enterococcus faecalis]
ISCHVHALVHPGEGLEPVHGAGDKQRHLAARGPGRGRADVVPEGAERLELGGQGPGDVLGTDGVEEGVRAGSGGGGGGHDGGGHDGVCSKRGVRGESRARGARAFSGGGRQWGERGKTAPGGRGVCGGVTGRVWAGGTSRDGPGSRVGETMGVSHTRRGRGMKGQRGDTRARVS